MDKQEYELALVKKIATFKYDPLGYVMFAFEWGKEGTPLEEFDGPDQWQRDYMLDMAKKMKADNEVSLQYATSSGHGIGKSALTAFITLWFMSTRPHCAGVITANTASQLNSKTMRELALWRERAINAHWFDQTVQKIFHIDYKDTWSVSAITNSEKNSEGFAGLHAKHVLIIYDEASAIPDKIYEVTEGAMTTPGAHWHTFSNPTRNTGRFKESFDRFKERWNTQNIDSRDCLLTDKKKIAEWEEDYGDDSDFFRVRVKGVFPRAASDQLIPEDVVEAAASRVAEPKDYMNYPKLLGVDVSRGGGDDSVIVLRQGPKVEILGTYQLRDLMTLAGKVVELFNREKVDHIYIDSTGLGAGVYDRLKQLTLPVTGVSFGTKPIDKRMYSNTRAEIWGRLKEWLVDGGSIPRNSKLMQELKQQTYGYTENLAIQLESKKAMKGRGLESPDIADAISCTFYGESLELLRPKVTYRTVQPVSSVGWT